MKIVTDHGFPKGTLPTDDAFDLFKNERDYVAKSGKARTTVAAMDWAAAEIERLRAALKPFAECAGEDESEIDYLVSKPGAVAAARVALAAVRTAEHPERG